MRRSMFYSVLLVSALFVVPSAAAADGTITDWEGTSATLTEGFVDSDGVAINYHTVGEGPLIILVHGLGADWWDYHNQIPTLATRFQVVAMSTRGTGKSGKPDGVEQYNVTKTADDIAALIAHFDQESAVIVGQDAGGFHAWNFAMTYPEKTDALIAMGSYHPAGLIRGLIGDPDQQKAGTFQRSLQEDPAAVSAFISRRQLADDAVARPEESDELFMHRKESTNLTSGQALVNFFKANWPPAPFSAETVGFGYTMDTFPPVQSPTLVLHGEDDNVLMVSGLNDLWLRIAADLTMYVIPDVGHGPHTEVPEFTTPTMMDWLASYR
jgi:pimeloyl-ACP methyl ester carboxylesterase